MRHLSLILSRLLVATVLLNLAGLIGARAATNPVSKVYRLGLYSGDIGSLGGSYTSSGGVQFSEITSVNGKSLVNEAGYVAGISRFYAPNPGLFDENVDSVAWVANAFTGTTVKVGFYSVGQFVGTRDGGLTGHSFSSRVAWMSDSGYVAGYSDLFTAVGNSPSGSWAWVADMRTGMTTRIGLDSQPDGISATQSTNILAFTESGYLLGSSTLYHRTASAAAAWLANAATGVTTRIGLYGLPGYQQSDGNETTTAKGITESGYAYGSSLRQSTTGTSQGSAAWVASVITGLTTRVGLTGGEFTGQNGTESSSISQVTESGYLLGTSTRYQGFNTPVGSAVWVANAKTGATTRIGLFGSGYITTDQKASSSATGITESGYIIGTSTRYSGTTSLGQAAWGATTAGNSTKRLGLYTGTEFTRTDGVQFSDVSAVSEAGFATGFSNRYNGSTTIGQAAWVGNIASGTTTRVGLTTGVEFTSTTGTQQSTAELLAGSWVAGSSMRYSGTASRGQAAWVAGTVDGTTRRVGFFTGAEFTRSSDNYQSSTVQLLNASGYAAGISLRYNGTAALGQTAWIANAATGVTKQVGLVGADFTLTSGSRTSTVTVLMNDGDVAGTSVHYFGTLAKGQGTWIAHASTGTTIRVGLFDAVHTGSQSLQNSQIGGMALDRYVWGESDRYNGNITVDGQTAWLFDLANDKEIDFALSVRASDGYAYSMVAGITDAGMAYGNYTLFATDGTNEGSRAFIWTEKTGTVLLDKAISDGIATGDWASFSDIELVSPSGAVIGNGTLIGEKAGGGAVYAMVLAVPEPNGGYLFVIGLFGCLVFSIRRAGFLTWTA